MEKELCLPIRLLAVRCAPSILCELKILVMFMREGEIHEASEHICPSARTFSTPHC
jgi:hypothetical protein